MKLKLKFLLKASRKLEALAPFPKLGPLVREIKAASKVRSDLIHGFIVGALPKGNLPVEMVRFIDPGHAEKEAPFTISAAEANKQARRATNLAMRFSQAVKELHDRYAPSPPPDEQSH